MKPEFCILHCADTPDNPTSAGYNTKAKDIDGWHRQNGWKSIGYHYVIERDGAIRIGRPETQVGAHCRGKNAKSLGICLVGRRVFTDAQMDALFALYLQIKARHGIDSKQWFGHYEFNKDKSCPNIDMNSFRERLQAL